MTRLLSRLAPTNLLTIGLIFFLVGINTGLGLHGPFGYLDVQLSLYATQQSLLADYNHVPGNTLDIAITAIFDAFMRGVTIGYNAPGWINTEHLIAIAGILILAATIITTRAWRYTTTTRIQ